MNCSNISITSDSPSPDVIFASQGRCAVDLDVTKRRVLVIDDDDEIVSALRDYFVEDGYHVASVNNGEYGLNYLTTHARTDLVILDLMMPAFDGYHFLRERSKSPMLSQVPIIVTTAYPKQEGLTDVDVVLRKPLDFDRLFAAVRYVREKPFF